MNQRKEAPLTGEITIKAKTPLDDISKPMTPVGMDDHGTYRIPGVQ